MDTRRFCGRTDELGRLLAQFENCVGQADGTPGPRMSVIVAESGLGKSRLVQELYNRLTVDCDWDPQEANYWPDAFQDAGEQVRVNPDMTKHVPSGAPRFLWLGARWTCPDARNLDESPSALFELLDALSVHAQLIERHWDTWRATARRAVRGLVDGGVEELVEGVADLAVPFGGILLKLAKGAKGLLDAHRHTPRSVADGQRERGMGTADALIAALKDVLERVPPVPVVLWLDDAQWMDPLSMLWVEQLWNAASAGRWPVHVVVTHWEREWLESLAKPEMGAATSATNVALAGFAGRVGVEVIRLDAATDADMRNYVVSQLVGLTDAQIALLVEKSGGNFLTMVENVGELKKYPGNFMQRDVNAALSPAGERKISTWASDRQRRVEERFSSLEPDVQDMLGWGSRLGIRFPEQVVVDFANKVGVAEPATSLMARCVSPYVILGRPDADVREFRDRAYHLVASGHFTDYGAEQEDSLLEALREHLILWVNGSFDGTGCLVDATATEESGATAIGWLRGGRRVALRPMVELAMRTLPLPDHPNWARSDDTAAMRAIWLAIHIDAEAFGWERVRAHAQHLDAIVWADTPLVVLDLACRFQMAVQVEESGNLDLPAKIYDDAVRRSREILAAGVSASSVEDLLGDLWFLALIEDDRGAEIRSTELHQERVKLVRGQMAAEDEDWSIELSEALHELADQLLGASRMAEARRALVEAIGLRRDAADAGDLDALVLLAESLEVLARIESVDEQFEAGVLAGNEAVDIRRQTMVARPGAETTGACAQSMIALGGVLADWDLVSAEQSYAGAETLVRSLDQDSPETWGLLAEALEGRGDALCILGDREAARACLSESVALRRRVAEADPSTRHISALADGLEAMGDLLMELDDDDAIRRISPLAVEMCRRLVATQSGTRPTEWLADALVGHGLRMGFVGEPELQRRACEEALLLQRELVLVQGTSGRREALAFTLQTMGDVVCGEGEGEAAIAFCEEAVRLRRELLREQSAFQARLDLLDSLLALVGVFADGTDDGPPRSLLVECDELATLCHEERPSPETAAKIADLLCVQSDSTTIGDDADEAIAVRPQHEALVQRARQLNQQHPCHRSSCCLIRALGNLAGCCFNGEDAAAAGAALTDAFPLVESLADVEDEDEERLSFAESAQELVLGLHEIGESQLARGLARKTMDLWESLRDVVEDTNDLSASLRELRVVLR